MAILPSASRPPTPHRTAGERCPWCDQPISHDKFEAIRRRMTAEEQQRLAVATEQFQRERAVVEAKASSALQQARAEAAAAAEQKVLAVRAEAQAAAEAVVAGRLATVESRLDAAEQARCAAQDELTTLKATHASSMQQRVEELEQAQRQEKEAAILAEKAKAFEDNQRLQLKLQELQRQLEGKSAHELGETSELDLFEQLRNAFQGDRIRRVGKGINGADVIHEIVHNGKACGKIIYDSKNRNAWQNEFANKLRADKLAERADHAVLSSNKFPKGVQQLHNQDGVIVAHPARILALAEILRRNILQTHELRVGNEEREQKTVALYAFITSERCKQLLDLIDAQAVKMLELDAAEEKAHRLTWERRNKLIRSVKKVQGDLTFEIDRIIGTAGNGPGDAA
jgi:Uncharacterized protein conserved in bacteria (DUF2130)